MSRNRKRKLKLWKKDPHCHWCNCLTEITAEQQPSMATIDHIFSKFNPRRWTVNRNNEQRTVLSCYSCNHERARIEESNRSKEELARRGRGYRLNPRIFTKKCGKNINEVISILKKRKVIA